MAEPAANGTSGKVVIRNVGLMLSGDIDRPILDADTVVVRDGRIAAVGREADCDTAAPDVLVDARGTTLAPGLIDSHVPRRPRTGCPRNSPACRRARSPGARR